jgi:CYTH domain-containing protein
MQGPSEEEAKYTRAQYERRFLVSPDASWKSLVESFSKRLEDKYLHGTRLRLRVQTDSDTGRRVLKLNRKTEPASPYLQTVSRILLSPAELEILDRLEGDRLRKVRYYHHDRGRVFSIDLFEGELEGLALCETEAAELAELTAVEPPAYVQCEVTEDPFFTGGNLCRASRAELLRKLSALDRRPERC